MIPMIPERRYPPSRDRPMIPERRYPPTPKHPAQPVAAVGTQDSPVFKGEKPQQVPSPVQTMAGAKVRPRGWWEDDWANIRRTTATTKIKHEQILADLPLNRQGISVDTPVEAEGYGDVVPVDFRQRTIQGLQHKVVVPERAAGGPNPSQAAIEAAHAGFLDVGTPALNDVYRTVEPNRYKTIADGPASVSPGFQALPVVEYHENALPLYK